MERHGLDAAELARGGALVKAALVPSAEEVARDAEIAVHEAAEKARAASYRAAVDDLWTWYARWSLAARAAGTKPRRKKRKPVAKTAT